MGKYVRNPKYSMVFVPGVGRVVDQVVEGDFDHVEALVRSEDEPIPPPRLNLEEPKPIPPPRLSLEEPETDESAIWPTLSTNDEPPFPPPLAETPKKRGRPAKKE